MGNKVVVALLAIVVMLFAAVLVVGVIFLARDTRSKATQFREADYDRCVARIGAQMESDADRVNRYLRRITPGRPSSSSTQWPSVANHQNLTIPEKRYGYYYYDLSLNRDDGTVKVPAAQLSRLSKYCRVVLK